MTHDDIFPVCLYIYDANGYHRGGRWIETMEQLRSTEIKTLIHDAISRGVEVRIADRLDFLVFHAKCGRIRFPLPGVIDGQPSSTSS